MGILDKLKGEFIDIVEWIENEPDVLVWRFPRYQNEIKDGAQLIVRKGQLAVFVANGKVADVFSPGMYELKTENLPILSTILGWKYGFHSPFKAEVYFISTRCFINLKWGTRNPVIVRDVALSMVRIRAFGSYVIKVQEPRILIRELIGTQGKFSVETISEQIRNLVVSSFADVVGEAKIPVLDLAAHYDELSQRLLTKISDEVKSYGLICTQMKVENISLPEETERAIDKRAAMSAVGESDFSRFQAAMAAEAAAKNSGEASGGIGLGIGMGMAQQVARTFSAPPPLPQAETLWYYADGNDRRGPVPQSELKRLIETAAVGRKTRLWREGLPDWKFAGELPDWKSLFPMEPPPLPKD